jgi:hypothetical protein
MLPVPDGQAVENRHPERLQPLLEHVLDGLDARCVVGVLRSVAADHLADHDADDAVELAGVSERR